MADAAITFARRSRFQRRLSQRNLAVSPLFLLRNSWSRFHGRTSQGIAQGRNTREQAHIHGEKTSAPKKSSAKSGTPKRWSQRVTRESDALDLKRGVFTLTDPKKIAASLKRSAEHSSRRKSGAYRSALSMLTFYINRAGKTLTKTQRDRLERAKAELKHQFGRD